MILSQRILEVSRGEDQLRPEVFSFERALSCANRRRFLWIRTDGRTILPGLLLNPERVDRRDSAHAPGLLCKLSLLDLQIDPGYLFWKDL